MRMRTGFIVGLLVAMAGVAAGTSHAQSDAGRDRPGVQRRDGGGRMTGEERQRLRDDLRRQHAEPGGGAQQGRDERGGRYAEWQRHSPEQREAIRRDLRDANRNLDRRRR